MDRSYRIDLEKLTTEKLDKMLNDNLSGEHYRGNEAVILRIIDILAKRERDIPLQLTPKINAAWDNYLKNITPIKKNP